MAIRRMPALRCVYSALKERKQLPPAFLFGTEAFPITAFARSDAYDLLSYVVGKPADLDWSARPKTWLPLEFSGLQTTVEVLADILMNDPEDGPVTRAQKKRLGAVMEYIPLPGRALDGLATEPQ